MKHLDAMYICTTPIQVMSAISLSRDRKELADMYIDPQFEGAAELAERIREQKIFDEVVVLEDLSSVQRVRYAAGKARRIKAILSLYRHIEAAAKEILLPERTYVRMYATHNVFIANLLMLYFSKKDVLTKVFFYDDGEGSYDNRDIFRANPLDLMARKLTLGTRHYRGCRRYYMYSPELFKKMHPENELPVLALPNFRKNPGTLKVISEVFQIKPEMGIKVPVVILDILKEEVLSPEDDRRIVAFYDRLVREFGEERVIVKRHPRDTRVYDHPIPTYEYPRLPFEITCLASDPDKMILITQLSTATIMPKLLLDAEPFTVQLYHIFERHEGVTTDRDRFFGYLKETYRQPDRIRIPETEEELEEILEEIRNMLK